jgi:DNA-binding winged helix-turn-helix (wHTH) protein
MPWDDFARVGTPVIPGPRLRGLCLGRSEFSGPLNEALAQIGAVLEEAGAPASLDSILQERTPDFVITTTAALGQAPDYLAAPSRVATSSIPRILITEERIAPESAAPSTCFDELLGSGQDALGYFLMLRSTLRRKRPHAMNEVLSYGDFSLDQEKFVVSFAGRQAPINKLQFSVLGAMLDAPRMVWNKVFLNRVVFGPSQMRPGRQFDTYMSLVRRPLRKELGIDPVVAEQRRGYALSHDLLVERNSRRTSEA